MVIGIKYRVFVTNVRKKNETTKKKIKKMLKKAGSSPYTETTLPATAKNAVKVVKVKMVKIDFGCGHCSLYNKYFFYI